MLFKKMAPFKHNKTDALLGWFHTTGGQCMSARTLAIALFEGIDFSFVSLSVTFRHIVSCPHYIFIHFVQKCSIFVRCYIDGQACLADVCDGTL